MCFSQEMSLLFSVIGLAVAGYAHAKVNNNRFTTGVLYFVGMEILQVVQFFYIDQCHLWMNQFLTVVGFAHICGQPYFTHLLLGAFYRRADGSDKKDKGSVNAIQNDLTLRLCVIAGLVFFSRYLLAVYVQPSSYIPLEGAETYGPGANTEWIRASNWRYNASLGKTVRVEGANAVSCTFKGHHHLAWAVPMYQPSYVSPSVYVHAFMMFAPFLATPGIAAKVFGTFLWLTGPGMAALITDDLNEQASIWCFFSIAQIALMFVGVIFIGAGDAKRDNSKKAGKAPQHVQ